MTREDIDNIISIICPNDEDFEKPIISPAYLKKELEVLALEQEPTGHWKRISIDKYSEHSKYWYRCNRCGEDNLGNTDWCPNCGVRMFEPQE